MSEPLDETIGRLAENIARLGNQRPPMSTREALAQIAHTGPDDVREIARRQLALEPLLVALGRVRSTEDHAYIRNSFQEGHKGAPGASSMSWRYYKRFIVPDLHAALVHPDTELIAAYRTGGTIVGWIAFARGRRVDTIHWMHTRYQVAGESESLRRRRVATQLLDRAALRDRIVYTFRGAYPKHRSDGKTLDEKLLPWLSARGQHAAYMPWEDWSK